MEVNTEAEVAAPAHPDVLQALRDWRYQEARSQGIPAYWILTNRTLSELAEQLPRTREALEKFSGLGPVRLERYGEAILQQIASLVPAVEPPAEAPPEPVRVRKKAAPPEASRPTRVTYPIPIRYWPAVLSAAHIMVPGTVAEMDVKIALTADPP